MADKIAIIKAIESGAKSSQIAAKYGRPRSTISSILKDKDKFLQAEVENKLGGKYSYDHLSILCSKF